MYKSIKTFRIDMRHELNNCETRMPKLMFTAFTR